MSSNPLNAGLGHLCQPLDVPSRSSDMRCAPLAVSTMSSHHTNESGLQNQRPKRPLPVPPLPSQKGTSPLPVTSSRVEYLLAILPTPSLEDQFQVINYNNNEEHDDALSIAASSSPSTTSSFRSRRNFSINSREPPSLCLSSPPSSPSSTSSLSVHSDSSDCTTDRRNKQLDALAILEGRTARAAKPETSFTSSTDPKSKRFGFLAQSLPGAFHVRLAGLEN